MSRHTFKGSRVFAGGQKVHPDKICDRCGRKLKPGGRKSVLCGDCRSVEPNWEVLQEHGLDMLTKRVGINRKAAGL